jgi:hypothetical protein
MAGALPNWEVFTHALLDRFCPFCYDDPVESLMISLELFDLRPLNL